MRFKGEAFRAHDPRWAFAPVSGEGARQHRGRFNPAGTPALYLSPRYETCVLEVTQGLAARMQPLLLLSYTVGSHDPDGRLPRDASSWR